MSSDTKNMTPKPLYISVDIEACGGYPPTFSMLQIGACVATDTEKTFNCLLKPINDNVDEEALAVSGLPFEELKTTGTDAKAAMTQFAAWLASLGPPEQKRIMVAQAAPFDWAFINYYFREYNGSNPFGFTCIDIKALYMGATGCSWKLTAAKHMDVVLGTEHGKTHDGLEDAVYQAKLFRGTMGLAKIDY